MQINEAQAQQLEMNGFKWVYKDRHGDVSTDRVDAKIIKRIVPVKEGFVVVYKDESSFVCSVCWVDEIEWTENPLKWIMVCCKKLMKI